MDPKENGVIADHEHKENHTDLRDQDQKADLEGMTVLPWENNYPDNTFFTLHFQVLISHDMVISDFTLTSRL